LQSQDQSVGRSLRRRLACHTSVLDSPAIESTLLDLSIVIVNHNSTDFLLPCVASIERASDSLSCETIVVDNASDPASVDGLEAALPGVTVSRNRSNLGFSAANNRGVAIASGCYLLFLNPDAVIDPQTLTTMVRFMDSHGDVGASTCFVRPPDGTLDDAAHRAFPTPWNASVSSPA
jgi:GT2 family glycosyltransferase